MRIKSKTVMDQMNAEKPDDVLADLEAKHGSSAPAGSAAIRDTLFKLWWRGDGWTTDESKVAVMTRPAAEKLKAEAWSHDPNVQVTSPPNGEIRDSRRARP